jgi:bacteriocin-like protein
METIIELTETELNEVVGGVAISIGVSGIADVANPVLKFLQVLEKHVVVQIDHAASVAHV